MPMGTALRRVAATLVDYAIVLAYVGVLAAVGLLSGAAPAAAVHGLAGRVLAQVVAAALLSVPATLWLAWRERSPGRGTPGKRLLGLRTRTTTGDRLSFRTALLRTACKVLLPWELAHTVVWNMYAWPKGDFGPPEITLIVLMYVLLALYAIPLFFGTGRTLYDRLCGTTVARS